MFFLLLLLRQGERCEINLLLLSERLYGTVILRRDQTGEATYMAISSIGVSMVSAYTNAASVTAASGSTQGSASTQSAYGTAAISSGGSSSDTKETVQSASTKSNEIKKASLCPQGKAVCTGCGACKISLKQDNASEKSGQSSSISQQMQIAASAYASTSASAMQSSFSASA